SAAARHLLAIGRDHGAGRRRVAAPVPLHAAPERGDRADRERAAQAGGERIAPLLHRAAARRRGGAPLQRRGHEDPGDGADRRGLFSIGLSYGVAIVLPIVTTFFLAFSVLEDSGYLPRLAAMLNRLFKLLGLNGKAVLPLILGLGCDTMATLTARILETKKE